MDKILLINKPMGMTSFDVVRECRHFYKEKKVGHTGTLDPNASGLLIVLLGKYTKLVPFSVKNHKHYIATFEMGMQTDTEDIWGTIINQKEPMIHDLDECREVALSMIGKQTQIPPMYSAKKINGKKLYELARKGEEVERKPVDIEVYDMKVEPMEKNQYRMDVVVSNGTYIRTLIQDYAKKMNEYATMTSLIRVGIEHLSLDDSITLEELKEGKDFILSPSSIISNEYKRVEIKDVKDVMNGKVLKLEETDPNLLLVHQGEPIAIYEKRDDLLYHCVRGLF